MHGKLLISLNCASQANDCWKFIPRNTNQHTVVLGMQSISLSRLNKSSPWSLSVTDGSNDYFIARITKTQSRSLPGTNSLFHLLLDSLTLWAKRTLLTSIKYTVYFVNPLCDTLLLVFFVLKRSSFSLGNMPKQRYAKRMMLLFY